MRSTSTKLAALGAVATLAFAGAACEASDDGSTSPGQEAPAGDLGTDPGATEDPFAEDTTGGDTMTDDSAGLESTESTTP